MSGAGGVVVSFPSTPALDAFTRDTAGMTREARRAAFLALDDVQQDRIRQEKRAVEYLPKRGLSPATIKGAGLRVERIGKKRARWYGFGDQADEAGECWALFLSYSGGVERLRLIDPADLERFGGGKYRSQAGSTQALYDPCAVIATAPDELGLIEGELNVLSLADVHHDTPCIGIAGKLALKPDLAATLAKIRTVVVWIDRRDKDPRGFPAARDRIARTLLAADVERVLWVPDTGTEDANDILRNLGRERAARRFRELFEAARLDGPYEPPPGPQEAVQRPRRRRRGTVRSDGLRDALRELSADEWVAELLDLDGIPMSRKVCCPVHAERTPSFHVYADHAHCHGCGAHFNDVFELAGLLWDRDPQNREHFKELLERLAACFNLQAPADPVVAA